MREIKFRAPIYYDGKFSRFLYWSNKGDKIEFEPDRVMLGDGTLLPRGERVARDSEQFTGLRDKNGREIYEGDIFHGAGWTPECFEVKFFEGGYYGFCNARILPVYMKEWYDFTGCSVIVIGNIHETPELVATA